MVGHGFQFHLREAFFILGGVHDLDCFGKHINPEMYTCVWKPGSHASGTRYTLVVQQDKNYCNHHINFTDTSKEIELYGIYDMEVEVFANSESTNCSKAVFKGSPTRLLRCGPPHKVSFRRHSGRLAVKLGWEPADRKAVENYSVRYKAQGSPRWSPLLVKSRNAERCVVENLNASLVYNLQIQCVKNTKCSQCLWSQVYSIPAELTTPPVVGNVEEDDVAESKGRRLLTLAWKLPAKELHDGFNVRVVKASGEAPREPMKTTHPGIRLVLSYSEYYVNISAFNNVSISPAASHVIPQRQTSELFVPPRDCPGAKLNVTVHNSTSFTIYWGDNLIANYVCYSVEWRKEGHTAFYKSFDQDQVNYWTLNSLPESLQPYQRYSIALHTRSNRRTCNMKRVNNSEGTYGTTQFYSIEGHPISAPAKISFHNVTLTSVELQWSSIPVEDARGFLLGYTIHYAEYQRKATESNITADPALNGYELQDLKSGATYKVQLSGFTRAGAGVRSKGSLFTTKQKKGYSNFSIVATVLAVATAVLICGCPIIKRMKVILWPSIPHPGNSKVMHKLEAPRELELLKSINTLEVEERDTSSLEVVGRDELPAESSPSAPLLHYNSWIDGDSAHVICNWIQGDPTGRNPPRDSAETSPDAQSSSLAFQGGYTTMETFQQAVHRMADTFDA
ncbi:leukemia inhibitory factor receptor [Brachionichthys hirsutus]|uniref:leukemia inhibitory factor receptor n=1 Tax=Brachionichthys hirsutus TaxID=412623 RepID=UPI0036045367